MLSEQLEPEQQWWELYPQMWAAELAALAAAGLEWEQREIGDGDSVRKVGWVQLPAGHAWLSGTRAAGSELRLTVAYPGAYPWFSPAVWLQGDQLSWLQRHRAPNGQLCLLHDAQWRPGMTLASLLAAQLPKLLTASDPDVEHLLGREELAELEMRAPEPSGLHRTGSEWQLLVDSAWDIPPEITSGYLLPAMPATVGQDITVGCESVGHIAAVYDDTGASLAGFSPRRLPEPYLPLAGRWVRLDAAPGRERPRELWDQIVDRLPPAQSRPGTDMSLHDAARFERLSQLAPAQDQTWEVTSDRLLRIWRRRYRSTWAHFDGRIEIVGLLHPDETTWRHTSWTWTFLLRLRLDRRRKWATYRAATGYAGDQDLRARAPHAAALADTVVTVIGVGAIGSRVAEGLAQAGVGDLHLIDRDVIEPGNLTRHTTGMRHVGMSKATAVADQIRDRAPATSVHSLHLQIGGTHLARRASDGHALIRAYVHRSDMIIDATADTSVGRYLAALCLADEAPYLHVSATAGGWGGVVVRIDPQLTPGCWSCLEHHRADGTVPVPPADPARDVLAPVGCALPTFTGAAADLDLVALQAVRVATNRLGGGIDEVLMMIADLYTATLRTPYGPVPAHWQATRLMPHPACPVHGGAADVAPAQEAAS